MYTIDGKYATANIYAEKVEDSCVGQIVQILNTPLVSGNVAIMPDCHGGAGCVIGFTAELIDRACPNVIGVDIGCGMYMMNLKGSPYAEMSYLEVDEAIREVVPFGTNILPKENRNAGMVDFPWKLAQDSANTITSTINQRFGSDFNPPQYNYNWFMEKCNQIGVNEERAEFSLGTLGGGNHFIEVGKSEATGQYVITIHSGSRKFGESVCRFHQKRAISIIKEKQGESYQREIQNIRDTVEYHKIPTEIQKLKEKLDFIQVKGLESLKGPDMYDYLVDMVFAQVYAFWNRKLMGKAILEALRGISLAGAVTCTHNYIDFSRKKWMMRKGAISAYKGEIIVIPFNQQDGILVCEGKGNEDWNQSAPHGAGRLMSRTEAKKKLNLDDVKQGMEKAGVFSTSLCKATLDEARGAYKDASVIERLIGPTAKIVDKIKPVHNLKDKSDNFRKLKKKGRR